MTDGNDRPRVAVVSGIADIAAADWDRCADSANPFTAHAFLDALERSGSATAETGWLPRHLVVQDAAGKVAAVAPLYLKSHSYGEYVFDWSWADAWHRAGGRYYPKLQASIPFTPVTGPRLMTAPGGDQAGLKALLAGAMVELARQLGVSSVHLSFPPEADLPALEAAGFLPRLGFQYHWRNRGYARFEDFLADLSSRRRKAIRKERAAVAAQGLTIRTLAGADITARHWDLFHRFYRRTVDRKWGSAYLRRQFFELLSAGPLRDRVVLVWAEKDGHPLAGAFNMVGGGVLYGRTWAADSEVPLLHFEACYYRAIDFAIAHGLERVEAGAQGEHKLGRGYLPVATHSAHWIADPGFRGAVAHFLSQERAAMRAEIALLTEDGPFRKTRG